MPMRISADDKQTGILSGVIVWASGARFVDLIAGFAIGMYVLKEALEIMREANEASEQL